MSTIKRRQFLQAAGSTLAAIGLNQLDFLRQGDQYGRALAQSTPRKLALLIGINQYEAVSSLNGCLTDVALQRHLLTARFGFQQTDILELTSDATKPALQPTRANILQAFEEHLIKQAKPGDVVVFHYSGHGSLVQDPQPLQLRACQNGCEQVGTLVPQDDIALSDNGIEAVVPDIMGSTLFLLMQAVPTEKLTVVLDSCHSGGGTRGSSTIRAADRATRGGQVRLPSDDELAYQQQWRSRLNLSPEQFQQRRQAGIANGVAIGSAQRDQLAMDVHFGDFYAGGFTYLLTRYLWQLTGSAPTQALRDRLVISTSSLAAAKGNTTSQVPAFDYKPGSNNQQQPFYFTNLLRVPAEAVITKMTDVVEFWLGGVAAQNLENDGNGNVYNLLDESGSIVGEVEQTGRKGLYGRGKLRSGKPEAAQIGRLLQERLVGITAIALTLGLDASLGKDLARAETSLATVPRVALVPVAKIASGNYLLSRITPRNRPSLADGKLMDRPPQGAIGLFAHDLTPLMDSFGEADEPIEEAISRLRPYFKRLLANHILGQLVTASASSPLKVKATVYAVNGQGAPAQLANARSLQAGNTVSRSTMPRFRSGTKLQVAVENLEATALYASILIIDALGHMTPLYPTDWDAPEEATRIAEGGTLLMPQAQRDGYEFEVSGTAGFPEILLLASTQPLRQALQGMQTVARGQAISRGAISLTDEESLDILDRLLGDVNDFSRSRSSDGGTATGGTGNTRLYDNSTLAVLSAVFEVVK